MSTHHGFKMDPSQISSLVDNWQDMSKICGQEIPGHDLLPIIYGIPVTDGYRSIHPNVVFYSKERKQVMKALSKVLNDEESKRKDDFVGTCKVQQLFKAAGMQQYVGVTTYQKVSSTEFELITQAQNALPKFTQLTPSSTQGADKFKRLHIKERLEQYDFQIELPKEGELRFDLYELYKNAMLQMVRLVKEGLSKFNLAERCFINGGSKS